MKVIVTGGNGFVGQHLLAALEGHDVHVLCRKKHARSLIDIEALPHVTVHYESDILDSQKIAPHFKGADLCFNLAALVTFYLKDRERLHKTNYEGTLNVLKACEENSVRLIHIGSTAIYGFHRTAIDENTEFDWGKHGRLVYSRSKQLPIPALLGSAADVVILNPPVIVGAGDEKIAQLIKPIKNNFPFATSGRNSVIDVRDLVSAMLLLMEKTEVKGSHIVTGGNYSFLEFNRCIAKVVGSRHPKIVLPKILGKIMGPAVRVFERVMKNPKLPYEAFFLSFKDRVYDDSKIRNLGYVPEFTLEDSFRSAVGYLEDLGEN